ncbi:MAG: SWIM zinc finger domain-containing protein [Candidatus Methylumidiphilus sp.]
MSFTLEQITRLAPDDASMKAAKGLANASHWPLLGASDAALWGECQGSGSKPYQVQMDRPGSAFRCTCPSRKFPCKHGLALLLLHTQKPQAFGEGEPPAWVTEWLAGRQQKAEKQEQKKAAADPPNPEATAKREAKRRQRMDAGADELRRWLHDQTRQGLANLRTGTDWRGLAARMVDAQAPGLGSRVQALSELAAAPGDWPPRLLAAMGQLQLLLDAWRRFDTLSPPQQADISMAMGWPVDKDEVLRDGERVNDGWLVLGQTIEENDKLAERRVWLYGRDSQRYALLLDFAHGNRAFSPVLLTGAVYRMTLAYYPSAQPRRALVADLPQMEADSPALAASPLEQELARLADAIAANPWGFSWPLRLAEAVLGVEAGAWFAQDAAGVRLPLNIADNEAWQFAAAVGGAPTTLFGEWDGQRLLPLSAWGEKLLWILGGQR